MPLGTMVLPALITPKSSFPSLSFHFSVSFPLSLSHLWTIICKHTIFTHMLIYTPYATACAAHRNTPELAAGPVICDAVWLGGRREFGWISVVSASILYSTSYIPLGHEWFSYHNIWGRLLSLARCYTRCFGAEFSGMKEWCNALFEGQVISFLWRVQ